jgi:hypothetical protein
VHVHVRLFGVGWVGSVLWFWNSTLLDSIAYDGMLGLNSCAWRGSNVRKNEAKSFFGLLLISFIVQALAFVACLALDVLFRECYLFFFPLT